MSETDRDEKATRIPELAFDKLNGLVPVVLQDHVSREVLMVGFVDPEAWKATCESRRVTLYRRTLGRVWVKGEDDGAFVNIVAATVDCDRDTVLLEVAAEGDVCHFGGPTCFIEPLWTAGDSGSGQTPVRRS